ncbi:MAG: Gfo/Idh/MocA family oxidoreductase [Bacteroidaceae bacterium]|jgi:predicted dehydrogenase|nr:Gfo/Idh/MocA family oxidoreductase [Bacteroidaceae bacterium]MBQ2341417.1 Gfo/Idh/MocA family oxidoreductase [Bacteroidaceae bacterium]MBQ6085918.1 Gfo/Idh/MocA family oxidoreductase [Bacteroidaceae bacterium]MBR3548353.1 Gfo/Idh/MocA family oxidoreductase [Bacteroidaceae bacterium]MBR6047719.1 Gfo/Idh/MocA family oxidoreductase [Bacteroidaceae bacterium]
MKAKKNTKKVLKLLGVGIGGRGHADINGVCRNGDKLYDDVEFIGLADTDWKYAKPVLDEYQKFYPNCKMYNDYRKMYAELLDQADAVVCGTADHTHAIICAEALVAGKHVYCEKPLTRTVYESRLLTKLAAKAGVATQMGNQGASGEGVNLVCEWIWNGEIGEVTHVDAFTDRPIWPQGLEHPDKVEPIPDTLNWDAWIGPAPMRDYNSIYTPWNFRGWWDFGTGALGDMACHVLHPVFKALDLRYPSKIQGTSTPLMAESCPSAEQIKYTFPARDNRPKVAMPEVELTWCDGGLHPYRPEFAQIGKDLNNGGGGVIFYGTKDTLVCGSYGRDPYLISGRVPNAPKVCRRVTTNHQRDWVRACMESPETRTKTTSDFSEAGPFNEMIAMGVVAIRLQGLNQVLEWDGENMKFTNIPEKATVRAMIKDGFSIHDGHPTFNKQYTEPVNAREFAAELIKPKYREGYVLPDMPA